MKYLKSFESEKEYNVGDWVKIKTIPNYVNDIEDIEDNLFVEITKIDKKMYDYIGFDFEFKTLLTNQNIYGNIYFIRKKMTKKEIEEFKIKIDSLKYNL